MTPDTEEKIGVAAVIGVGLFILLNTTGCVNHYQIKANFYDESDLTTKSSLETVVEGHSQIRDTAIVYQKVMRFLNEEFFKKAPK